MSVGSVAEATAEAKAAFEYYDQTGFLAQRTQALTLLARGQERTGDLTGAQKNYEALLKSAVESGNQGQIARHHDSISGVLLQREQYVAALQHSDESLPRFRTSKTPYDIIYGTLQRAEILWRLGRLDEADRELDAMFGPNSGMGKPTPAYEHARALRRARVLLARNENARAAGIARSALARATDVSGVTRAALQRVLVLALARSGRAAEALAQLDAARGAADESTIRLQSRRRRSRGARCCCVFDATRRPWRKRANWPSSSPPPSCTNPRGWPRGWRRMRRPRSVNRPSRLAGRRWRTNSAPVSSRNSIRQHCASTSRGAM